MINVVMPMAGNGSRFFGSNYDEPKPLIRINNSGTPMFALATLPIPAVENFIFITRSDIDGYDSRFEQYVASNYPNSKIVAQDGPLAGAVLSTLQARDFIDTDAPLLILDSDIYSVWDIDDMLSKVYGLDGAVLTFKSSNPAYSYVKSESDMIITEIAEKNVISSFAGSGGYFWSKGSDYVKYADQLVNSLQTVNGEFYISNVYKTAISDGKKFINYPVAKHYSLGTPEDLSIFSNIPTLENGSYNLGLVEFDSVDMIQVSEFEVPEINLDNSIKKITNLFKFHDVEKPTKIVKGKTFIAPLYERYWHYLHEVLAQYEVLKSRIPDLNIYFIDVNGLAAKSNFNEPSIAFCKSLAEFYLDSESFSRIFTNLEIDYNSNRSNLLFEEVYLITDYSDLISPTAWEKAGVVPPWNDPERDWEGQHYLGEYGRDAWIKEGIQLLRSRLIDAAQIDESLPKKIYVSRADATKRYLTAIKQSSDQGTIREALQRSYDETKLEEYFMGRGYTVVNLEWMSYRDQINYFHNAEYIAGLVGSGFCNIIYSKPGSSLVELHVVPDFEFNYYYLIKYLDIDFSYIKIDLRSQDSVTHKYSEMPWDSMVTVLNERIN